MITKSIKRTSKWEHFLENIKIPGVTSFHHVIPRSTTAKKKKIVETWVEVELHWHKKFFFFNGHTLKKFSSIARHYLPLDSLQEHGHSNGWTPHTYPKCKKKKSLFMFSTEKGREKKKISICTRLSGSNAKTPNEMISCVLNYPKIFLSCHGPEPLFFHTEQSTYLRVELEWFGWEGQTKW